MNEKDVIIPDQERGISICSQSLNYHVYKAGPCFSSREQAVRYRDYLDSKGIKWEPRP